MKAKELKPKSKRELIHLLLEEREKLRQIKFDLASRKLKDMMQICKTRRNVARILTLIKQAK